MIVLDASILVEILLETDRAASIASRVFDSAEDICAPHLIDVEVAHAVRRYAREREFETVRGRQILEDLADLPIVRYPHVELLDRIWTLRENLTAYDAAYVALAEILDSTLVTCDSALYRARDCYHARVELL